MQQPKPEPKAERKPEPEPEPEPESEESDIGITGNHFTILIAIKHFEFSGLKLGRKCCTNLTPAGKFTNQASIYLLLNLIQYMFW